MTILYGKNVEFPDAIYDRAIEGCRVDSNGCWIWYGAKSGRRQYPQIGAMAWVDGVRKLKVVPVAKLIYVVKYSFCPWQIRRDKIVCTNKLCVNPDHFYAVPYGPGEDTGNGERS